MTRILADLRHGCEAAGQRRGLGIRHRQGVPGGRLGPESTQAQRLTDPAGGAPQGSGAKRGHPDRAAPRPGRL